MTNNMCLEPSTTHRTYYSTNTTTSDTYSTHTITSHTALTPSHMTTTSSTLNYYGYRYYSTDLGRWINRDPIGKEGGLNIYGFVENSSIYHVDSDGRFVFPVMTDPQWPDYCHDCSVSKVKARIRQQEDVVRTITRMLRRGQVLCAFDKNGYAQGNWRSPEAKADPACVKNCVDDLEDSGSLFISCCDFFIRGYGRAERRRSRILIRCLKNKLKECKGCPQSA